MKVDNEKDPLCPYCQHPEEYMIGLPAEPHLICDQHWKMESGGEEKNPTRREREK
ncbi:MAG: hypothetical protein ACXABY_31315 [Candidatus Thorarchaeota archaeon]